MPYLGRGSDFGVRSVFISSHLMEIPLLVVQTQMVKIYLLAMVILLTFI